MQRDSSLYFIFGFSLLFVYHQSAGFPSIEEKGESPRITEQPADTIIARHLPATLNCRATGVPTPVIKWFKDGLPLRLSGPHRVQLPTGELFFLRVSHGRQHSDAGVYFCEANNPHGTVVSRMASLQVAVLREEFRLEPVSTRAAQGDTILLECAPPRGTPEPKVSWKKNGESLPLDTSTRLRIVDGGNLVIQNVKQSDEGRYQCVAGNTAGTRESVSATLNVHIKPYIIIGPQDVVALTGSSVKFQCQVGGDPLPDVLWRRSAGGGNMPLGRVHILEDRSLKLDSVTTSDSGFYTCEADNAIGGVYASGYLEVHSIPNFTLRPMDTTAEPGLQTSFDCCAVGNPMPTLFWSIEYEKFLLFPGTTISKYSAIKHTNGTSSLIIKNLTFANNNATVICSAVNQAGAAISKARLLVISKEVKFPPIIYIGPSNQSLPYHATAILYCKAYGEPVPTISWYHNGSAIISTNNVKLNQTGELIIKDVSINNNGIYTCVASSVNGKYILSGTLSVESDIYSRSPNINSDAILRQLPTKPTRPEIIKFSQTQITIIWLIEENIVSSIIGYRVEMYSKVNNNMQWNIIADKLQESIFTYNVPQYTNTYWFFVRAENRYGFSEPSDISDEINIKTNITMNNSLSRKTKTDEVNPVLELLNVIAIDSTAVKLTWKVFHSQNMYGFYIYYGPKNKADHTEWQFLEISILTSINTNSFVIRQLKKFTNYEIFLVPFFENIMGTPSNSRFVETLEDVPDVPPSKIEGTLFNSSSVRLEWQSPPLDKRNGLITHYAIIVTLIDKILNQTVLIANVTNKHDNTVFMLTNLTAGIMYSVQIAAATKAGIGPLSTPAVMKLNSPEIESSYPLNKSVRSISSEDLLSETWFLTLVLIMATILAMLCAVIFAIKYRHILTKNSTIPEIYEHTSYGTNLVTHMKSAVGIAHPLDSTFCQNISKPNTFIWNGVDGSLKNSNVDYPYRPENPPGYEKNPNLNMADYAEVDPSMSSFKTPNVCKTIPSPAAYASVLIVDNNLPGSRCWIQKKIDRLNTSNHDLEEDEDIYPAYNGGYYNRNVYYDNFSKSNSILNASNDFSALNCNNSIGTNIIGSNTYDEEDSSKQNSSAPNSSDGSCLLPSYLCKIQQNSNLSAGLNVCTDNTFLDFNTEVDDSINMYQEIKTPDRVSGDISLSNNSSSENSDPYFNGSIQPMKLLNNHTTQHTKKGCSKPNSNILGSFTMNKATFLKSEYYSSTKSEPSK